jgi:hypothetical protein
VRTTGQRARLVSRRAHGAVHGLFSAGPCNGVEMGRLVFRPNTAELILFLFIYSFPIFLFFFDLFSFHLNL